MSLRHLGFANWCLSKLRSRDWETGALLSGAVILLAASSFPRQERREAGVVIFSYPALRGQKLC